MLLENIENKVIRLVEERGVAASKYNVVAKKIVNYCEQQALILLINKIEKYNYNENEITFTIPKEITEEIDFIENLEIHVTITDTKKGSNFTGGGNCTLKYSNEIVDNKIKFAEIEIHGYCYYGALYTRTILSTLYHELNHCYDYYNDVIKNYGTISNRMINQFTKSNIDKLYFFLSENYNSLFEDILYRLFSETELNALIASVYGDLQSLKSKRENFKEDLNKVFAYNFYKKIKKEYKNLYKYGINEENFTQIKNYLNGLGIYLTPYNDGVESFKKELIRKTSYLLSRLIKGIGRAASVYYDNMEFKPHEGDSITHIDKNNSLN